MTTREEIQVWLEEGKAEGATHTIIVCDTFDYEDYPVHVMPGTDVNKIIETHRAAPMSRVLEVYSHTLDHKPQLAAERAWNL